MDSPRNSHNQISNDIPSNSKDSSNYIKQNIPENTDIPNMDKETLNLFKGIVKITRINSMKINKSPIRKSNSEENNNKNIFTFIDKVYNNEDHLNHKQIHTINNLENISPNNKTMSLKRSCSQNLIIISKNKNTNKKSLFKKEENNLLSNSPKRTKKGNMSNNKGNATGKYKSHKNYSFFLKLKEKNKIPSKTPYLDKKAKNSSKQLNSEDNWNDINGISDNKKLYKISNKTFFEEMKIKNDYINNKDNEEEKNNNLYNSDKKLEILNRGENKNNIIVYKDNNNDKKLDEDKNVINNNKKQKSSNDNNKEKKHSNNLIINVLNRPFLCCLKS